MMHTDSCADLSPGWCCCGVSASPHRAAVEAVEAVDRVSLAAPPGPRPGPRPPAGRVSAAGLALHSSNSSSNPLAKDITPSRPQ